MYHVVLKISANKLKNIWKIFCLEDEFEKQFFFRLFDFRFVWLLLKLLWKFLNWFSGFYVDLKYSDCKIYWVFFLIPAYNVKPLKILLLSENFKIKSRSKTVANSIQYHSIICLHFQENLLQVVRKRCHTVITYKWRTA